MDKKLIGWILIIAGLLLGTYAILETNGVLIAIGFFLVIIGILIKQKK